MALPTPAALEQRIRRAVADYPQVDTVAAGLLSNTGTTVTVGVAGSLKVGTPFVVGQETLMPTAITAATATVVRGWFGTTAQTHAVGDAVLVGAQFSAAQILDAINEAYRALWPYWFQWIEDEATLITTQQADYALPSGFGESGIVTDCEILYPGLSNDGWRGWRWFRHREGTLVAHGTSTTGRTIQFTRIPPAGTYVRMVGIAPLTTGELSYTSTLPTTTLDSAIAAIVMYACGYLMAIAEAGRLNNATAKNIGPLASQPGQNQATSQYHFARFDKYCMTHGQRYPRWRTRRTI